MQTLQTAHPKVYKFLRLKGILMREKSVKPIIAITMGDPAGVGPEVITKALSKKEIYDLCNPVVVGDSDVLRQAMRITKLNLEINSIKDLKEAKFSYGTIDVIDLNNVDIQKLEIGKVQEMAGRASLQYIETAVKLVMEGKAHAVVTAPINKEAIHLAGSKFPGHTEMIAHLTGAKEVAMMLVADKLRVFHVTLHMSLKDAVQSIKKDRVLKTIKIAYDALRGLGIENPKIAVAGLNPHASDGGLFGDEEEKEIAPAIKEAREIGINAIGPIPPDSVFYRALKGEFDGVVAMYHDQGHIPIKLIGFMKGVNVTVGLPIIRTSVDHGTAYDIAADPQSLIEAIKLATQMAKVKFGLT